MDAVGRVECLEAVAESVRGRCSEDAGELLNGANRFLGRVSVIGRRPPEQVVRLHPAAEDRGVARRPQQVCHRDPRAVLRAHRECELLLEVGGGAILGGVERPAPLGQVTTSHPRPFPVGVEQPVPVRGELLGEQRRDLLSGLGRPRRVGLGEHAAHDPQPQPASLLVLGRAHPLDLGGQGSVAQGVATGVVVQHRAQRRLDDLDASATLGADHGGHDLTLVQSAENLLLRPDTAFRREETGTGDRSCPEGSTDIPPPPGHGCGLRPRPRLWESRRRHPPARPTPEIS